MYNLINFGSLCYSFLKYTMFGKKYSLKIHKIKKPRDNVSTFLIR